MLWQKTNLTIFKRNCFTLVLRILITIIPAAVLNRHKDIYAQGAAWQIKPIPQQTPKEKKTHICLQSAQTIGLISWLSLCFNHLILLTFRPCRPAIPPRGVDSRDAGGARAPPGIWGFIKGAKSDFCLSEFSYYSKHLCIWKAIYGAAPKICQANSQYPPLSKLKATLCCWNS